MAAFDRFYYPDGPEREPYHHGNEAGESLAATMAAMFAARGNDFAVGLLVNARHFIERFEFVSGSKAGKLSRYKWLISIPPPLYALYVEQDQSGDNDFWDNRDDFVAQAWRLGGPLMENIASNDIVVSADLLETPRWREAARSHLAGAGVTNQGNVHVQTRPKILHDELWFRHIEEQYIYEALLRRGHPFMPLPVVMRANGKKRPNGINSRIEPDFCILYKGRLVVLEVDGGSHWESPADAEKRILFLREHGAIVRRISADDCGDQEKASLAVADELRSLEAELARGGGARR